MSGSVEAKKSFSTCLMKAGPFISIEAGQSCSHTHGFLVIRKLSNFEWIKQMRDKDRGLNWDEPEILKVQKLRCYQFLLWVMIFAHYTYCHLAQKKKNVQKICKKLKMARKYRYPLLNWKLSFCVVLRKTSTKILHPIPSKDKIHKQ